MYENGQEMQQDSQASGNTNSSQMERNDGSLIKASHDEERKMFVGGLSWETDEAKLRNYFTEYGLVQDCTVKRDGQTGQSRGFGFVLFADASSVDKVIDKKPHLLDSRTIDPKRAKALKKDAKLFVGGLNPDTDEDVIKAYFERFGEIDLIERPNDRVTGKKKGFCFISFTKDGVIANVIKEGKFHQIDGRQCECKDGDPKRQKNKGVEGSQYGMGMGWGPQEWYGAGYGYGSYAGYGGYGSYGGPQSGYGGYSNYPTGYGGYGAGYGGYGGYSGDGSYGGQAQTQNSGGKAKTAGRGGQNNYKPY
ncbi:heterogeneous nuclear ribonucleoprotein A/B-like isoform X2 [Clavelina lepadiformis]|uniref:RRM domain-containing protein n=1 Tax=Clavelina lepadiformis TaxID=159417 RepID=A0ABP0EYX6_CLALP